MRILIVEDSHRLRENLVTGLRHAGYAVDDAAEGQHGLWLAQSNPYDVIVLDLMLPGLDGMSILRKLRDAECPAAVLILTAKDQLQDKVAGLRQGADDYLVKPFAFDELLARVESLVRRRHGRSAPSLQVGPLSLDTAARTASVGDKRLDLSVREYGLLEYLMLRRGEVVSRPEIESHLYDQNATLMSNVVDTLIYALRKK
ncbi:MAG: DNA-binding response regulator, partial [Phycisphaerales bacterium]|nr:DNA-binding response regulator [Phycisphaerales bacterium]